MQIKERQKYKRNKKKSKEKVYVNVFWEMYNCSKATREQRKSMVVELVA